jgi:hypothetical protein
VRGTGCNANLRHGIRQAAHSNALLQGQLQQVQANQRRAAEQHRAQVAELEERMEAAATAERQKVRKKLGQLQPFMPVSSPECMGQPASFGPT